MDKDLVRRLMFETEKLLQEVEDLKLLNKLLLTEVVWRRKSRYTPDEEAMMIRYCVACEMEREAERWEMTKLFRIKGGFEHECWF